MQIWTETDALSLPIVGQMAKELQGTRFRNGPIHDLCQPTPIILEPFVRHRQFDGHRIAMPVIVSALAILVALLTGFDVLLVCPTAGTACAALLALIALGVLLMRAAVR